MNNNGLEQQIAALLFEAMKDLKSLWQKAISMNPRRCLTRRRWRKSWPAGCRSRLMVAS